MAARRMAEDWRDPTVPPWLVQFDGLYEPRYSKRGIATYGFVVRHGSIASANVAEFGALICGLAWLRDHGGTGGCPLRVEGDNRLAIETVAGRWNLTSAILLPLRDAARGILAELGGGELAKVSRERNAEADRLSREAYREATAEHPEWGLGIHSRTAHGRRHHA